MSTGKFTIILLVFLQLAVLSASGQQQLLKAVPFTTGGTFLGADNKVSVAMLLQDLSQIQVLDTVLGDFSNDIITDHQFAYAHIGRANGNPAGKDMVIKYDLTTGDRIDSIQDIAGLQEMAIHEQYLLISRGFGAAEGFFQIFLKDSLSRGPIYTDSSIPSSAFGIISLKDTAYVSYNVSDTAYLAKVFLDSELPTFAGTVVLDTLASNLGKLFTDGTNIYGLSERTEFLPPDFAEVVLNAGLTVFDPATQASETFDTPRANGGIDLIGSQLFANFGGGLDRFNFQTQNVESIASNAYTAGTHNPLAGDFFLQQTDFFSFGQILRIDQSGNVLDTFQTDISGSAIQVALNTIPLADNDTLTLDQQYLAMFADEMIPLQEVLANDNDPDNDPLTIGIVNDTSGLFGIRNDSLFFQLPIQQDINEQTFSISYEIIDSWGDRDTASLYLIYAPQTTNLPLSIEKTVSVFPNPAIDRIWVKIDVASEVDYKLFDITGAMIDEGRFFRQTQLDVATVVPGLYILSLGYKGVSVSKKIRVR